MSVFSRGDYLRSDRLFGQDGSTRDREEIGPGHSTVATR